MRISQIIIIVFLIFPGGILFSAGKDSNSRKNRKKIKPRIKSDWRILIQPSNRKTNGKIGYVEVFPYAKHLDPAHFAVITPGGARVKTKLLWSNPGEPFKIMFDNAFNLKKYYICFSKQISPQKKGWEPEAGLILETRKRATGTANNWKEADNIISRSKETEGRSPVDKIFLGINPHGESKDIVSYFRGYLNIKKSAKYKFAIAADDAVFLFIDGRKVAEWPGWHSPWGGVRGRYSGKIYLKKGVHKLEYYNIENDYGLNMVCGWQPPGKKYPGILPSDAFVPLKKFRVKKLEYKGSALRTYFSWKSESRITAGGISIIKIKFTVINPLKDGKYKWTFDDSSTAEGREVSHLFFSTGLRKVKLKLKSRKKPKPDTVETVIKVSPCWQQREEWPKSTVIEYLNILKHTDLSKLPAKDLVNLEKLFETIEERKLMAKVGKICLKRKKEFAGNPELFYQLSQCYIHYSVRDYNSAEKAYLATIEFSGNKKKLSAKSKLYYAALKIHNKGECDKGIKLLNEIDDADLAAFEKRKKMIWLADAYMTKGELDSVDKIYKKLPDVIDRKSSRSRILNEARIFNAIDYLRREKYNDAEKLVWQIEWEYPYEAMNSQTGLIMTEIFIKRREYNYALWRCMRMMNAAGNSQRMSDIILTLIKIYKLTGRQKEAEKLSARLWSEYPYSEAAARLKEPGNK